jgi:hypothetical protein
MVFDSRRVLEGQPTMELTLYPHLYLDGAEISGFGGSVPDRTKDLFDRIEKFIRAAYPGEKFD